VFIAAFSGAALVTALAIFLAAATPGNHAGGGAPGIGVLAVLAIAFLVILGLVISVGLQVYNLVGGASDDAGVRLHRRFVSLFAIAAVAPAVIVALFFGLLVTRGMDSWFSKRVQSAVEGGALFGRALVKQEMDLTKPQVGTLAHELNRPEFVAVLGQNPVSYSVFLEQAVGKYFDAVYLLDSDGRVLARAETPGAGGFVAPPAATLEAAASSGEVRMRLDEDNVMRALYRLSGYHGAFLYVARPLAPGLIDQLRSSEQSIDEYRESLKSRSTVQAIFLLSYLNTALLVLVGAVFVGMSMAGQIADPVARLVSAAGKVSEGDLSVRVALDGDPDEIAVLSRAFNRMTADLETKQSELKHASIEAHDRRQFIETVLAGVSAGVVGLDIDGRISVANRRAFDLLGLDPEKPEAVFGALLVDAAPEMVGLAEEAQGRTSDVEQEIDVARGGETRRLRIRASGSPGSGLVITFDDITRLVSAQRSAAWRDVARRIAHEIKNPLTPIQLSAERIQRKYRKDITGDLETFDRCTDTIIRQVGDIGRMVDEFSAFARMPAPKFAAEDASEMLRQAVFAQRVAYPDIIVSLDDPGEEASFLCDGRMVGQALTNILKNAGEAVAARVALTPEPPGAIQARLIRTDGELIFEIQDNGVGLPTRNRHQLTEPYVTTREKGTGLGLAIVKRILEEHEGELLLADADQPPGAKVQLRFPRGRATSAASREAKVTV
jgi:two-component system nitrogen regulation sensor histidine kinase NtrY